MPVARLVPVAGRAVEDRCPVVLVEALDRGERVLHPAGQDDPVGEQVLVDLEQPVLTLRQIVLDRTDRISAVG